MNEAGVVLSVSRDKSHNFSKPRCLGIRLIAGLGVEGDAHYGVTVQHRSRIARTPDAPNLRQVHLIHTELFEELQGGGFRVEPGDLGENVTTRGIDLLALPTSARLHIGREAVVEVTGLRNPCIQIDRFQKGLMAATLDLAPDGQMIRKAGIMGIVIASGDVHQGDPIRIALPAGPHRPLAPV